MSKPKIAKFKSNIEEDSIVSLPENEIKNEFISAI